MLSGYIPNVERIVTIEDAAELQLKQEHVVRLETRAPNIEGKGAVRQRQLVINSLRMRPDRIIVGEVRGEEAFDMLQAMNTGHEGLDSPPSTPTRYATLLPAWKIWFRWRISIFPSARCAIRSPPQFMGSFRSRVYRTARARSPRFPNHRHGGDVIAMQEIFTFERQGIDEDGKVRGTFRATGIRPHFAERLASYGSRLRPGLFESRTEV